MVRLTASAYRANGAAAVDPYSSFENVGREATATVKTKAFGFNLGKFGLDYSSKDLEVDAQELIKRSQAFRRKKYAREQKQQIDVQSAADVLSGDETSAETRNTSSKTRETTSKSDRKRGLGAYTRAALGIDSAMPRMLIAVA